MHPEGDGNEAVREKQRQEQPFDADTDPAPAGTEGDLSVVPDPGGYAGRDPKTQMPAVPSVPETQEEPAEHDGAPSGGGDRPAHG